MPALNTDLLKKGSRAWTGQIGAGGVADASTATIPLSSTTNLPTDTAVVATIDRVDSSGTATPSLEEVIIGVVSGSNLVTSTRGVEGTAQAHSAGAVVEILFTARGWNDLINAFLVGHTQLGAHGNLGNVSASTVTASDITATRALTASTVTASDITATRTLTAGSGVGVFTRPKITTSIDDSGGNEVIRTPATASAVNDVTVTNAATGNPVIISATGDDTNIDLKLLGKGTGKVLTNARYGSITADTDGATVTFDMAVTNTHTVTLAGNRTLALSNVSVGQYFVLRLLQDATGSRTVTWFTTIKWAGGVNPVLTTTASKADAFGFLCTSSGNYDGFIVGANI